MSETDHPGRFGPSHLDREALTAREDRRPKPSTSIHLYIRMVVDGGMGESDRRTGEVEFGPSVLIDRARERLREALTMLGAPGGEVDDEVVTDAGVLVVRAGEMLEDAFRMRVDERATVRLEAEERHG